jgi:hypothetical protein
MMRLAPVLAFVIGAVACTEDPAAPEEIELIGRDWTVSPGELYKCVGIRAERDMYISGFTNLAPLGEHHAVVTVADDPGTFGLTQVGEYDCTFGALDLQMLYASGVGEASIELPDGAALEVKAGQFINLNLHLFNTTNGDLTMHSGVRATVVPSVPPEKIAEMIFVGTTNFNIAPGETGTASGGCNFTRDATVFAYWPHMHQFATHQKLTMTVGGEARVMHDAAFDFMHQATYPIDPTIAVHAGDSIQTECTFTNTGSVPLTFGDSSTAEMCLTGLYRYPKQAYSLFECTEGRQ